MNPDLSGIEGIWGINMHVEVSTVDLGSADTFRWLLRQKLHIYMYVSLVVSKINPWV